jgi:hypothetical protein
LIVEHDGRQPRQQKQIVANLEAEIEDEARDWHL